MKGSDLITIQKACKLLGESGEQLPLDRWKMNKILDICNEMGEVTVLLAVMDLGAIAHGGSGKLGLALYEKCNEINSDATIEDSSKPQ